MNNLETAKKAFAAGAYSCVLAKDGILHTSTKAGVAPLVEWLTQGVELEGFSAADKIVGKAAAMLFTLGGVKEVYAPVMSEQAVSFLASRGVSAAFDIVVKEIANRAGTGRCPMEEAVAEIDDPAEALKAVKTAVARLQAAAR